jgi:hypothetical protein
MEIQEYEKEFEAEWKRIQANLPISMLGHDNKNCKLACYGFYLFGRNVTLEAFIKQMRGKTI